jgi:tetratricopeptide (TPR) repeat protein
MRSRSRWLPLALPLLALLFLSACSGSYSEDLLRAQQEDLQGDTAGALKAYEHALTRVPSRDHRTASIVQLRIGLCQLRLAQPNEAFLSFQKAVMLDAQNLEAHRRMAELLLMGGATQKAAEELTKILKKDPDDASAIGTLGAAYASAGDTNAALQLLERSFSLNAGDPQVAITLAELYNRLNRPDDARRTLIQSATRNSGQGDAWLALGRLEEQEGRPEAADSAYRSAVKADDSVRNNLRLAQYLQRAARLPEAEAVLRRVDAKQPGQPSMLADFLLISGRADAATAAYAQGRPPREPLEGTLIARSIEARVGSRDAASAQPQARAARELLVQQQERLDPVTRSVLQAEIALVERDLPSAEVHARAAVAAVPNSVPAWYVLGLVLKQSGRRADAKAAWNTAFQAEPGYVPTRLALAAENLDEGDLITAEEQVTPVVREEPANLSALVLYARVLEAQKRWDSAESIARRALEVDPSDPQIHVVLGNVHAGRKQFGDALVDYQRALALDSQSVPALEALMNLYKRGVLTRASIARMENVASQPPASAPLVEIAGRLYAERGLYADAARALQKSLVLDPRRSSAALALMQLSLRQNDTRGAAAWAVTAFRGTVPAIAELVQGREAELRSERAKAINHYESALRLGEPSGAAANNLAWIYAQQGVRLDRALDLARRASELDPKNPAIWDTLGAVLLRRRDYTAAADALTSARKLSESSGASVASRRQIYKHLAEAYAGAGLPARAEEMQRKLRE